MAPWCYRTPTILTLPDSNQSFVLKTDTSRSRIGVVVSQAKHPIAFFKIYSACGCYNNPLILVNFIVFFFCCQNELHTVTQAIARLCHYLLRHKFFIRTNQKSLKALTDQIIETQEQEAWLHKLLEYDFTVEYKLGKVSLT